MEQFLQFWHRHDAFLHNNLGNDWLTLTKATGIYFVASFLGVFLIDNLITRHVVRKSARWFCIHTVFNAFVVVLVSKDAFACVTSPMTTFEVPRTWSGDVSTVAIGAFHLYHSVFFTITMEDVIHHAVNTGIVVLIGIFCDWGALLPLCNFVMCGFPGGIDYGLLTLVKCDVIEKMTEKKINRHLNNLIRWPVMFLGGYIFFVNVYNNNVPAARSFPMLATMTAGCLAHMANAAYYSDRVVGNYHVSTRNRPSKSKSA